MSVIVSDYNSTYNLHSYSMATYNSGRTHRQKETMCTVRLTIDKFSEFARGESTDGENKNRFSDFARLAGCRWNILSMPRMVTTRSSNDKKAESKYLGFYIQCTDETNNKDWSCKSHAILRIVSQRQDIAPQERQIQHKFTAGLFDWGYARFNRCDVLLNEANGYIKDDKVVLEVDIFPEALQYVDDEKTNEVEDGEKTACDQNAPVEKSVADQTAARNAHKMTNRDETLDDTLQTAESDSDAGDEQDDERTTPNAPTQQESALAAALSALLESDSNTEVRVLASENRSYKIPKHFLTEASPKFDMLLNARNQLDLRDVAWIVVKSTLSLLLAGCPLESTSIEPLHTFACRYDIVKVKKWCHARLLERLNSQTVVGMCKQAVSHHDTDLSALIIKYIHEIDNKMERLAMLQTAFDGLFNAVVTPAESALTSSTHTAIADIDDMHQLTQTAIDDSASVTSTFDVLEDRIDDDYPSAFFEDMPIG